MFHEGNKVEMEMHFGCQVYVFDSQANDLNQVLNFLEILSTEEDDERWDEHASFFTTMSSNIDMSFHDSYIAPQNPVTDLIFAALPEETKLKGHKLMKQHFPYIIGKVEQFDL